MATSRAVRPVADQTATSRALTSRAAWTAAWAIAEVRGCVAEILGAVALRAEAASGYHVAVDAVGAGVGEVVLYATGSAARQTDVTDACPVDAVIMAIVDNWEVDGEFKYRKSDST